MNFEQWQENFAPQKVYPTAPPPPDLLAAIQNIVDPQEKQQAMGLMQSGQFDQLRSLLSQGIGVVSKTNQIMQQSLPPRIRRNF